ncbi:hypothetical protein P7C70_g4075, partial [Phenoliferia sp. Uapishka_3]
MSTTVDGAANYHTAFAHAADPTSPAHSDDVEKGIKESEKATGEFATHAALDGNPPLKRQLKNRHIQMISIGGVIGTGLFLGTANALRFGGPVITIVGLIILGLLLDWGVGPENSYIGNRYWKNPGPFVQYLGITGAKGRFLGYWRVLIQASFSYIGTEITAIAAGEAKNPKRNLPKVIRRVWIRICRCFFQAKCLPSVVSLLGLEPKDHSSLAAQQFPYRAPFQPFAAWYALIFICIILFFNSWEVFARDQWDTATFITSYLPIALFPFLYGGARFYMKLPPQKELARFHSLAWTSFQALESKQQHHLISLLRSSLKCTTSRSAHEEEEVPPRNFAEKFWMWIM